MRRCSVVAGPASVRWQARRQRGRQQSQTSVKAALAAAALAAAFAAALVPDLAAGARQQPRPTESPHRSIGRRRGSPSHVCTKIVQMYMVV